MEPLQDEYQGIKDPALSRLIECLAERNDGLCIITTREPVKEFEDFPETTRQVDLEQLSPEAGRALLRVKRIRGNDAELEAASEAFGSHALAVNLLASFLKDCAGKHISHAAEIPDLANLDDPNHRHPRRVMAAFAERFGDGPELDLLHIMGLFDRPATGGCIAALRADPAIPALTEKLSTLDQIGWRDLLDKLRDLGLLAPLSDHGPDEQDAHPLVREHFGASLRAQRSDAWKAGNERLYEYLKTVPEKDQPDTLAEMAPLFQAIHHGCQAGRRQGALDEVYFHRVSRDEFYLWRKLGANGSNLAAIASFFDPPWKQPATDLAQSDRAWLLNEAALGLRALGRHGEAVTPARVSLKFYIEQMKWSDAAQVASNLSELQLALGSIKDAQAIGEAAIEHAHRIGDAFPRMLSRTALANARHQMGNVTAAHQLFEEAEVIQAKHRPHYPWLFSTRGYQYCNLLFTLGQAEAVRERASQTPGMDDE